MAAKFRYPSGKRIGEEDDYTSTSLNNSENEPESAESQVQQSDVLSEQPNIEAGLSKLVDFIRKHAKQRVLDKNPEHIKKTKAVKAYKKIKDAA